MHDTYLLTYFVFAVVLLRMGAACVRHVNYWDCPKKPSYSIKSKARNALKTLIWLLEQVQKRATKLASQIKHLPYKDRLNKLGLPSTHTGTEEITWWHDRGFQDTLWHLWPKHSSIHVPTLSATTGGHNNKLFKSFGNKNVRQKYFTVCVIETWNSSPHDIVNANSVNGFKNRLDKYWANQELQYSYHATLNTESWMC